MKQDKQKENYQLLKSIRYYNSLSPMMKIVFSSQAQQKYAETKDINSFLIDLRIADVVTGHMLTFYFSSAAQAQTIVTRDIAPANNKKDVLTYTDNALSIGDSIVFRMVYAYKQNYGQVDDFRTQHPYLEDSQILQRQIALLKRYDRTPFSMLSPTYSAPYFEWIKRTSIGKTFHERRQSYATAIRCSIQDLGIERKRIALPHTGVGREFIREIYRERE